MRTAIAWAMVVVGVAAGCSTNDDKISCTATLGETSSEATFDRKDETEFSTTLGDYVVAYTVTDGGNGLRVDLINPDQSIISTNEIGTTTGGGSADTPDGTLAFQCSADG